MVAGAAQQARPTTGMSSRRLYAAMIAWPVVGLWLFAASHQPWGDPSWLWWTSTVAAAGLGAGVVAGYVPERGSRPDLGCTPCAAMSGLTLLGSTLLMHGFGGDLAGPALAAAITAYGLVQRSASATRCAVAPGP